jgi:molecular chaperone HtpG
MSPSMAMSAAMEPRGRRLGPPAPRPARRNSVEIAPLRPHIARREGGMNMSETATAPKPEQHDFGAEVGRLLDLVVHSLYSEREIFLRELVANAADAIDRRRFEALTHPQAALPEGAKVRIVPARPERTLTISDDGIGMTREELMANLGTIARSGTRAFGETLAAAKPEERPSLIGQFGVGFYSAFMVAERVEVTSRRVGTEEAWLWASDGRGSFTIAPATRAAPGTDVVLRLKPDAQEYLDAYRIETVVRKWADHVTIPITIERDGKDVPANEGTALWRKPKSEVSEQSYTEFYRHLGVIFDKPWATLHWRAEGALEFYALLFIPGSKPFEPVEQERQSKIRLHVRRMFITEDAELLPPWLRFVKGIVDTEDLPLNVSREMLQSTPVLARIRKALTNRVLTELKTRAKEAEDYIGFWENFGPVLKEGVWEDNDHRKDLAPLLRFRSSTAEGWTSFADYVGRMKPDQEAIYVLAGDGTERLGRSAQLEGFTARGVEVLLLGDAIDAFWPERMGDFEGKPIRSITQGAADLSKLPLTDEAAAPAADTGALVAALKSALGEAVSDVRTTDRLVESAVVLAAGANGPDLHMQRLLRRAGRAGTTAPPVLEINPRHALIAALAARQAAGADLAQDAGMLLDLARVQDGEAPRDPAAFARRLEQALAGSLR